MGVQEGDSDSLLSSDDEDDKGEAEEKLDLGGKEGGEEPRGPRAGRSSGKVKFGGLTADEEAAERARQAVTGVVPEGSGPGDVHVMPEGSGPGDAVPVQEPARQLQPAMEPVPGAEIDESGLGGGEWSSLEGEMGRAESGTESVLSGGIGSTVGSAMGSTMGSTALLAGVVSEEPPVEPAGPPALPLQGDVLLGVRPTKPAARDTEGKWVLRDLSKLHDGLEMEIERGVALIEHHFPAGKEVPPAEWGIRKCQYREHKQKHVQRVEALRREAMEVRRCTPRGARAWAGSCPSYMPEPNPGPC